MEKNFASAANNNMENIAKILVFNGYDPVKLMMLLQRERRTRLSDIAFDNDFKQAMENPFFNEPIQTKIDIASAELDNISSDLEVIEKLLKRGEI